MIKEGIYPCFIITTLAKSVDKADDAIKLPFYWNADRNGTQYLMKQKVAGQQTNLKTLTQKSSTTSMAQDELELDLDKLAYGANQFVFSFYELDQTGTPLNPDVPDGTLTLTITVNGSLRIESVPDNLYWTNRMSDDSIGILDRDTDNDIKLSVIDSRENQTKDWSVQTNLTIVEEDIPFGFVWKESDTASYVPMNDSPITIMSEQTADKTDSYEYSQTWTDQLGVLLQSKSKVVAGNYSGKVIVNWTITEAPS